MTARATHGEGATVWTIGHSTHTWEEFTALLGTHGIEAVADVRRFPGSRRYPWFVSDAMASALPETGVDYRWIPALGERRKAQPDSPNTAWRNAAFRGYADYMATAEFAAGLAQALDLAASRRTALMCAEAVWWRCHRRLISDLLQHRGIEVLHILDAKPPQSHPRNPAAQFEGTHLIYPDVEFAAEAN